MIALCDCGVLTVEHRLRQVSSCTSGRHKVDSGLLFLNKSK